LIITNKTEGNVVMKVIAQKVFRIGLQKLLYDEKQDQYYVGITNRTYHSLVPIRKEKVNQWKWLLT